MTATVHKLIRDTAIQIAGAVYDDMALDNVFYAANKDPYVFIERNWPKFIVAARESLATMLTGTYPDETKNEIYDALIADASLPNVGLKGQLLLN